MVLLLPLVRSRFGILLCCLLLFLLVGPQVETDRFGVNVPHVLAALIYVAAVHAVAEGWRQLVLAVGLAVLSLILGGGARSQGLRALGVGLDVSLLAYTCYGLLNFVFGGASGKDGVVTTRTLVAAVCVYLLVGLAFARIYFLLGLLITPPPVVAVFDGDPTSPAAVPPAALAMPELVYFSFTTLTTVGYGDYRPTARVARSVALVEAVTGPLYLAVLIGRLVGMHVVKTATRQEQDDDDHATP